MTKNRHLRFANKINILDSINVPKNLLINSYVLIDRLEKGILNTDFSDFTDSFLFGLKGMKKRWFLAECKVFIRFSPKAT